MSSESDRRIAARYPGRSRLDVVVWVGALIALLAAVVLVAWAGVVRSNPPVVGMVRAFEVPSPSFATAEIVVQRSTPADQAACFLFAQAENFERVAEVEVTVPPGEEQLTVMVVELRTVREATSVSIENCWLVNN